MRERISLESAIEKCCEHQRLCREIETIPVEHGLGRVVTQELRAYCDMPPFNSSRMDGYAISRNDLARLKDLVDSESLSLQVVGCIPAGSSTKSKLLAGQTIRIMTGAMVPEGAAAIIRQEDITATNDSYITFGAGKYKQDHIQFRSSLIRAGQILARQGERLDCNLIERLASAGISDIPVYRQPAIYIINTGSELILPGNSLTDGKIYNSNRAMLTSRVQKENCKVFTSQCPLNDELAIIRSEISRGLEIADMIIITGGAAEGDFDLVPLALEKIEAVFLYHGLQMQPGAKSSAAVKDGKLIFSLPGNPAAGQILFDALIMPVLNKFKGIKNYMNNWFHIGLSAGIANYPQLRLMCWGELREKQGSLAAAPLTPGQSITGIRPVILDIQPGQGYEGDIVRALLV